MAGYMLKWGRARPGWSMLTHLKKQYRNDAILKPALLETLMSVPITSSHYMPEERPKEIKFKEDKYLLEAYKAAKKLSPSLSHKGYNYTIDYQINLMKKGLPALHAGRLATAQIMMEQRIASIERAYRRYQASEYVEDPATRRRKDWTLKRQAEKLYKLKFIFETIVHQLRVSPERHSIRLTLEDLKAQLDDPTLTDLELNEALNRYPPIHTYLHEDLRESAREFTRYYFSGLHAIQTSRGKKTVQSNEGAYDPDAIPEDVRATFLEEHLDLKAETEKEAGTTEAAETPEGGEAPVEYDELDAKARAALAKEKTVKYRQQQQERAAKRRARK